MSGLTAIYDCGSQGCDFLMNEKPPDAAVIHKALQAAKKQMDKAGIMIPDNPKETHNQSHKTFKLRGASNNKKHFCQDEQEENDFLEVYHCGPNRIDVCHYNGVHFTTICASYRSPLFRNLSPRDYCGACEEEDVADVPRQKSKTVMFYQLERPYDGEGNQSQAKTIRKTQRSGSPLYEKVQQQRRERARLGLRNGARSDNNGEIPVPSEADLVEAVADLN